jgi:hypothetical protein
VHGEIVLNIFNVYALPVGALNGLGIGVLAVPTPASPGLIGKTILIQGIGGNPASVLSISTPTMLSFFP